MGASHWTRNLEIEVSLEVGCLPGLMLLGSSHLYPRLILEKSVLKWRKWWWFNYINHKIILKMLRSTYHDVEHTLRHDILDVRICQRLSTHTSKRRFKPKYTQAVCTRLLFCDTSCGRPFQVEYNIFYTGWISKFIQIAVVSSGCGVVRVPLSSTTTIVTMVEDLWWDWDRHPIEDLIHCILNDFTVAISNSKRWTTTDEDIFRRALNIIHVTMGKKAIKQTFFGR